MNHHPDYQVVSGELSSVLSQHWNQRPLQVIGYALTALLFFAALILFGVYLGGHSEVELAGWIVLVVAIVVLIATSIIRCREAQARGATVVCI